MGSSLKKLIKKFCRFYRALLKKLNFFRAIPGLLCDNIYKIV